MTFVVYSKQGCPHCQQIQTLFELNDFKFVSYELDRDFNREEFYEKFGEGSTFPQIKMNDISLGGCTNTIKYLQDKDICCRV